MYNAKIIESFIDKVNAEAEAAAQAVYDKYQKEFERKVLSQMRVGDVLFVANGTATFEKDNSDAQDNFCSCVSYIHYTEQKAGFHMEYKTIK